MLHFCGNVLEVQGTDGKSSLVMSSAAHSSFTAAQLGTLASCVDRVLHSDISNIERVGGGSVRCCLAELF